MHGGWLDSRWTVEAEGFGGCEGRRWPLGSGQPVAAPHRSSEWQGVEGRARRVSAWSLGLQAGLRVPEIERPLPAEGAARTGFTSIQTVPAPVSYLAPGLLSLTLGEVESGPHSPGRGMGRDGTGHFCQVAEAPKGALLAELCRGFLFFYIYGLEKKALVE